MNIDELTNKIIRLQRRRLVIHRIHQAGQLTRESIAALWRTSQPASNPQLIRWAINETNQHDQECDCDQCALARSRATQ